MKWKIKKPLVIFPSLLYMIEKLRKKNKNSASDSSKSQKKKYKF